MSYDPLSIDAQLSAILTRMDAQDKVLEQVLQQCIKTNGRVTQLEGWRASLQSQVVIIATALSFGISALTAWFIKHS